MPSVANPLWLLLPLLALVVLLALGSRRAALPGSWPRVISADLQDYVAASVEGRRSPLRGLALAVLWLLMGGALATISLGQVETPVLRNLDARIVVIDLGVPDVAEGRVAASRYLIDGSADVPTAVIAVTEHAFDVVPLTRDDSHLDRYLQVLTRDVMPEEGRSLLTGVERAIAVLDRAGIQARQITVFTGGDPPPTGRFQKPDQATDHNIWLVLPDQAGAEWQAFADELDASLASDRDMAAIHADFEERRNEAAARTVPIRERRDLTPWLIVLLLPLWLWLFFRRPAE